MKKILTIPLDEWQEIIKEYPKQDTVLMWKSKCDKCSDGIGTDYFHKCTACKTRYRSTKYSCGKDTRFIYVN